MERYIGQKLLHPKKVLSEFIHVFEGILCSKIYLSPSSNALPMDPYETHKRLGHKVREVINYTVMLEKKLATVIVS